MNGTEDVWLQVATKLGWRWSAAHDGFISENHREGPDWADYAVKVSAEDACFADGIETLEDARSLPTKEEG